MPWYHYVSYFFGGAFLVNAIPHVVAGTSGHPFQSPFAKPPGKGLSSPLVNVLWGAFNIAIGYLLVCQVGDFDLHSPLHSSVAGLGALLMAVYLSRSFGRLHKGNAPRE
ncbi:hypothetical protein ACSFBF_03300 [Variovorax sp. ZT5P49]|uniref:hypothetical protein n=1 Tax=Variovorax sp. ZT5P49 TaxID=3443733 RepID=UPI003F480943